MSTVAVIDYGMGNLHSIAKALQHVAGNTEVIITSDKQTLLNADRIVFPGVGAMRDCMQALNQTGLDEVIKTVAQTKPLLGICLGMQANPEYRQKKHAGNYANQRTDNKRYKRNPGNTGGDRKNFKRDNG